MSEQHFEKVWARAGGHALTLAVLRDTVALGECTWTQLADDLGSVAAFEYPASGRSVISHILGRHATALQYELQVLKWLGARTIDDQLLRSMVGLHGCLNLRRRSFLNAATGGLFGVHEIMLSCLGALPLEPSLAERGEAAFWEYFARNWPTRPYHFRRSLQLHSGKVADWVTAHSPSPTIQEYVWLLIDADSKDPDRIAVLQQIPLDANAGNSLVLACIIEALEWASRLASGEEGKRAVTEGAVRAIDSALPHVTESVSWANLSHHRGKLLRHLHRDTDAIHAFEAAISRNSKSYQSDLQIARIAAKQTDYKKAQTHIRRIITAYGDEPESVPITVVLAAFAEMAIKGNADVRSEFIIRNPDVLSCAIQQSNVEGFSQPYNTVARLGRQLYWDNPGLLVALCSILNMPGPLSIGPKEAFDVAECLKTSAKAQKELGAEDAAVKRSLTGAEPYYAAATLDSRFQTVMYSEWLILMDRYEDAVRTLESIPHAERDVFANHRLAQALLGSGKPQDAHGAIVEAISKCSDKTYMSAFLEVRADVEQALSDRASAETLRQAIRECQNPKYRAALESKLAHWS